LIRRACARTYARGKIFSGSANLSARRRKEKKLREKKKRAMPKKIYTTHKIKTDATARSLPLQQIQNFQVMTKQEFIYAIEQGAILPVDASKFSNAEIARMAKAAHEHNFVLEVQKSDAFKPSDIAYLGSVAPGHVAFPDIKILSR